MVHGLPTSARLNELATIKQLSGLTFERLPELHGWIHGVESSCESHWLFRYPAVGCRLARFDEIDSAKADGCWVWVVCDAYSVELIGKGQYHDDWDSWAEDHCTVLCNVSPELKVQ
jgi:hypothetical protein